MISNFLLSFDVQNMLCCRNSTLIKFLITEKVHDNWRYIFCGYFVISTKLVFVFCLKIIFYAKFLEIKIFDSFKSIYY